MPLPVLLFGFLASAVAAPIPPSTPITVTGHAWAPFISPMGEPFRAHTPADDTLANWFHQADQNHDGVLTLDEMQADADRFFATLDTNHDGEIGPDELAYYEWEIAPDIQVMSRTMRSPGEPVPVERQAQADRGSDGERRGHRAEDVDSALGLGGALQGAARYSLLNIPEPVAAADTDFNRGISLSEFRHAAIARFQLLDTAHHGGPMLAQLEAVRSAALAGRSRKRNDKAPDARVGNPLPPGD